MKKLAILFCLACANFAKANNFLNLDFEYAIPETEKPKNWYTAGKSYTVKLDKDIKKSGQQSLLMSSEVTSEDFGVCTGSFPIDKVRGKKIKFKGFIKTESVTSGWAGLWWRVDGKKRGTAFDNMKDNGAKMTTDWTEYSIELDVSQEVTNINFGCLLVGSGKAWFDNFEIFVDGKKFEEEIPRVVEPTEAELTWLKSALIPLKSYEPESENSDLTPLLKLIGPAEVVGLGENTHGSREIFKMKHKIVKALREKAGFDIFSIEANMPEAYKVNDYVQTQTGNPEDLIRGMYFWTWNTEEVKDMVNWMATYNKNNKDKISFTGFDMQFAEVAFQEVKNLSLATGDADLKKLIDETETELNTAIAEKKKKAYTPLDKKQEDLLLKHLAGIQVAYQKNSADAQKREWLIQNIKVIDQYLHNTNGNHRDKCMADNLLWIKKQNPQSKIAIWAHNGHIQKTKNRMGEHLDKALKSKYVNIGFAFHDGNYTATGAKKLGTYKAQGSYAGTYEYFFNAVNEPIFALDLRTIPKDNPAAQWLLSELEFRHVGSVKMDAEFSKTDLVKDFDIVIFINKSNNSVLLKR